jgi:hypothetical protein
MVWRQSKKGYAIRNCDYPPSMSEYKPQSHVNLINISIVLYIHNSLIDLVEIEEYQ